MNIRPIRGQCLVELLPADARSAGGIEIPEVARYEPPTENGRVRMISPRGPTIQGIVRAVGPWPQVRRGPKRGFQIMPEFAVGDRVIVGVHAGTKVRVRGLGDTYKLVDQLAVMAVVG